MADKYLIVTNIPNPYRIPLFNHLNKELKTRGWELTVIFARSYSKERKFEVEMGECDFEYTILESKRVCLFGSNKEIFWFDGLLRRIKHLKPKKIVVSGFSIGTMKIWVKSLFAKCDYYIWGGTIPSSPHARNFFIKFYRRILASGADGFIAYGSLSKKYFYSLGAPENKISVAINTVDTDFFSLNKHPEEKNNGKSVKHLTYIGYLTKRKNVMLLLRIVKYLVSKRKDFVLDIIGDGPEKGNLMDYVERNDLSEYIIFHGFKQKQELPFYLSLCDVFLFQTDFDIWGLVLNEAMAAGKVCIASVNAGAHHDLIEPGKNGFIVDFRDTGEVASRIGWVLDNPEQAVEIGRKAASFIQENARIVNSVEGFLYRL